MKTHHTLCAAALMMAACTTIEPTLHLQPLSQPPAKALAMQQNAELSVCRNAHGGIAYLTYGDIVCPDAGAVANVICCKQTPITVHITYLATLPMITRAVHPLLEAGLKVQYVTAVNNRDHIPFVYSLSPVPPSASSHHPGKTVL